MGDWLGDPVGGLQEFLQRASKPVYITAPVGRRAAAALLVNLDSNYEVLWLLSNIHGHWPSTLRNFVQSILWTKFLDQKIEEGILGGFFWANDRNLKFWAETRIGRRVGGTFHAADSDSSAAVATWPQNISLAKRPVPPLHWKCFWVHPEYLVWITFPLLD